MQNRVVDHARVGILEGDARIPRRPGEFKRYRPTWKIKHQLRHLVGACRLLLPVQE